jgi:hypothetical protein
MNSKNFSFLALNTTSAPPKRHYQWLAWLFIIIVVIGPRVLDLDVFYARDELTIWPWADQFALAVWAGDLAGTLTESDYPGIPMFWGQTLFLTLKYNLPALFPNTMVPLDQLFEGRSLDLLAERRLVGGLLVSLQIIAAVWMVRRLFGWPIALLSAILLGLDPFSLTEARVLRLEMISAYFVCLSMLSYFVYFRDRQRRWILISGIMAGLGVSSKTSAGLVIPYIWLLLLLDLFLSGESKDDAGSYLATRPYKQVFLDGLTWAAGAIGAFWLIWPAMWVQPITAIQYVFLRGLSQAADRSVWGDNVFFWGQIYPGDPGPLFYPVALLFRTTPLTWVGVASALILLGRSILNLKRTNSAHRLTWPVFGIILLLGYIILIIVELTFVISKVDRFLLIVFPALNILSAIGLAALMAWAANWLTVRLKQSPQMQLAYTAGLIALVTILQLAVTLPAHPYYFTYWNPLSGGGQVAMKMLPIGVGEGIDQAMDYLNSLPKTEHSSLICGASRPWCAGKFVGNTLRSATYVSGDWVTADYASFYISALQRRLNPTEVVDFFMAREPLYQVDLGGVTYVWVYDIPNVGHFAGPWNDLAGLGRLLGYDFGDPEKNPGDTVHATIWWVNQGAGVEHLLVRLVDQADYEWVRAGVEPLPEYASISPDQPAIVAGTTRLTLPPGMPPGLYFWKIGVKSAQNEQLLGEFSMPRETSQLVIKQGEIISDSGLFDISTPVNQLLTPEITLLGYTPPDQVLTAQEPAWLTLFWQATAPPADYEVLLRLLTDSGEEIARWQGKPGLGQYPTVQWQPGEIVQDVWPLQVEPETPVGQYNLEISLLNPDHPESQIAHSKTTIEHLQVWPQPISYVVSEMQAEVGAEFGNRLTLLGYDLYFDTDGSGAGMLSPVLYWQSQADFEEAFDLLITLRDSASDTALKTWQVPLGSSGTKAFWKANEVINTTYPLEADALAGAAFHLDIALQNQATGQPVPVRLNDDEQVDYVRIEDIQDKVVVRLSK